MASAVSRTELDADGFERLLAFLERGKPPMAGYEAARARLIDFFRWRGVREPETYADRTFDRVAAKLAAGESPTTDEPFRYLLGVARFIYLEGTKSEVRARRALEQQPEPTPEPDPDDAAMRAHFDACLAELHPNERRILVDYHRGSGQAQSRGRRALAESLGVSIAGLRMRIHRLRQRVEKCVRARQTDDTKPADRPPVES